MSDTNRIARHWARNNIYATILNKLEEMALPLEQVTLKDLAPIDHFHSCGFPATTELADRLDVAPGQHVVDIGCGLGGPARYMANRFQCKVSGVDITPAFVEVANKLTVLLRMQRSVMILNGDGHNLPFSDGFFDGGYTQHVTMNVADRPAFYAEAYRVLKPGGFFAVTEIGMGPRGQPHYPMPWSTDGSGSYLVTPDETCSMLEDTGFTNIDIEFTWDKYLAGYQVTLAKAELDELPPLGTHLLMGDNALQNIRNSARNIEEQRTQPIALVCRKPH